MSTELQEMLAFVESVALKDNEAGRALHAIVAYLANLEAAAQSQQTPAPTQPQAPAKPLKGDTSNGN